MTTTPYAIYAIRYAMRKVNRPTNFVGGDPHDAPMDMDYFVWLVRNAERSILLDTGSTPPWRRSARVPCCAPSPKACRCWDCKPKTCARSCSANKLFNAPFLLVGKTQCAFHALGWVRLSPPAGG